ncbi:SIR2 family protein [Mesorhizobium atlanticum]|uniref:SIR2 family protein n=1 Tax=Mesorhizobium atlanticum TaxID=2233532 RepID=A0A330GKF4_9HYPH|nr:SIR2 family protein [Mesorhizobium atlanticum]RAZ72997.1 SIR2 family protein [Mesorhizobium atlanticum]
MADDTQRRTFKFLRNGNADPEMFDWAKGADTARQAISESMSARNIAFLLGAGCSSLIKAGAEVGISTMAPLAKEFCSETLAARAAGSYGDTVADAGGNADEVQAAREEDEAEEVWADDGEGADPLGTPSEPEPEPAPWRLIKTELEYLDALGIDLEQGYNRNLERLMEVLFAQRFVLRQSGTAAHWPARDLVDGIIQKVQTFLWARVTEGAFAKGDTAVRDLYERFYKKLVLRDRSLPRPWVFTTNYDHFNEMAMDRLGIPYANGFSGVVERRFNPATFRYALAEQLDVASRKWTAVDAFVYLCKLHGSVTWTEDDHGLFPIRETWPPIDAKRMMIYPTPAKQNSSLGSPYADLFREFQSRIVREQSVLITAGYAFGDEHLNNIIYQALTIPTFRLVIFADPDMEGEIAKLRALRDPRIWIIGGDGPEEGTRAHYFDMVVEHFLPQRASDRIDEAVRKVLSNLAPAKKDDEE